MKFVKELSNGCCDGSVASITNLSLCGGIDLDLKVIDAGLYADKHLDGGSKGGGKLIGDSYS